MKVIKVSSGHPRFSRLLLRQTPSSSGIWNNTRFILNQHIETCDAWFVLHHSGLRFTDKTHCNPQNIFYASMEPSEKIGNVSPRFLSQFPCLIACDPDVVHPNLIRLNYTTWWAGISVSHERNSHVFQDRVNLSYDDFIKESRSHREPRLNRVCCIISGKASLPGHRQRLEFLESLLKLPIGRYTDIFGPLGTPFADKHTILSRYKYSLVFENTILDNYWSEKLGDSFLCGALPFYSGCPNADKYFPSESFVSINNMSPKDCAELMLSEVNACAYEVRSSAIDAARDLVLNDYNVFSLMDQLTTLSDYSVREHVKLNPNAAYVESSSDFVRRHLSRVKSILSKQ